MIENEKEKLHPQGFFMNEGRWEERRKKKKNRIEERVFFCITAIWDHMYKEMGERMM